MRTIPQAIVLLGTLIASLQPASSRILLNDPYDVGLGHAHIIHDLQNRMAENPPKNHLEYLHAISLEMRANLCDDDDVECNYRMVQRTIDVQPGPKNGYTDGLEYVQSILPDDFDSEVMDYMEKLFFSMSLAEVNVEKTSKVLALMNNDLDELADSSMVLNEMDREIGMIAYSVAMESTKQWTEILSDSSNPYHAALINIAPEEFHKRHLQTEETDESQSSIPGGNLIDPELERAFLDLLEADLIGATEGAIENVFSTDNNTVIAAAVEEAAVASMKSVVAIFLLNDILGTDVDPCEFPDSFFCEPDFSNLPDSSVVNDILSNVLPPVPPGVNGGGGPPGFNGGGGGVPPGFNGGGGGGVPPGFNNGVSPPELNGETNPTGESENGGNGLPPNNGGVGPPLPPIFGGGFGGGGPNGNGEGPVRPPLPFDPCGIPNNNPFCPGNVNSINPNGPVVTPETTPTTETERPDPPAPPTTDNTETPPDTPTNNSPPETPTNDTPPEPPTTDTPPSTPTAENERPDPPRPDDSVAPDDTTESNVVPSDDDCLFPNNPSLCVDGGNNIPLPEEPPIDPSDVCFNFPNLPICQNGGLPPPDPNRPPPPLPPFLNRPQQIQPQPQPPPEGSP